MTLQPGEYEIGPSCGRLLLRSFRQGLAARAGHDLVMEASTWRGHVSLPSDASAQPSVSVEVDMNGLEVLEGTGGLKPLTERDKQEIKQTMKKPLKSDQHPLATFTSSAIEVDAERATIDGQLALAGQNHPLRLAVQQDGNVVKGTAAVVQSTWGIKPYTGFFGALKLQDPVEVEFSVALQPA